MTFNEQWFDNLTTEEKTSMIKKQVDKKHLAPWVLDAYIHTDDPKIPTINRITRKQIETYVALQLQREQQKNKEPEIKCLLKPWKSRIEIEDYVDNQIKLSRYANEQEPVGVITKIKSWLGMSQRGDS